MGRSESLETPSRLMTTIMVGVAAAATGSTTWYMWSGRPRTLFGLAAAALILWVPLMARWPVTPRRPSISAAVWFPLGLIGRYGFGVSVVLASLLLALGVGGNSPPVAAGA